MKKWNILSDRNSKKPILELLLENRGIIEKGEQEKFLQSISLNNEFSSFSQEFKENLIAAKKTIADHITNNLPIIVFGDYDADGVCATAILYNTLTKELNHTNTHFFIPDRFEHGYGISIDAINQIRDQFSANKDTLENILIITVDTGITAVEEIAYIKSLGGKIVLTDHHQKPEVLPNADTILWNDQIVGSVISWLLAKALGSKSNDSLALAGIATVTDVQKLVGINRTIVKKSLEILNSTPPSGIKEIIKYSGIGDRKITSYDLGWIIGPRLNASGRIINAEDSLKVLIEDDLKLLDKYTKKLDDLNKFRQDKTQEMYEIAFDEEFEENLPKIIIADNERFHEGIIGLVSSRLVQKHNRPAIVIAIDGQEAKGSVRSIRGINIIDILREFSDIFIKLGGHPMAAGFSIESRKISHLKDSLTDYFEKNIDSELLIPTLDVDLELMGR